jgi:hypothetical protein
MPNPVTVELTLMEFLVAIETAKTRMVASAMQQINHATTYDRTWVRRLHEETVGACGEIAVGKYLGAWFVPSVNTFHRVPDCLGMSRCDRPTSWTARSLCVTTTPTIEASSSRSSRESAFSLLDGSSGVRPRGKSGSAILTTIGLPGSCHREPCAR